jgi:diguanylate cyclase (GGDEF)-like protein
VDGTGHPLKNWGAGTDVPMNVDTERTSPGVEGVGRLPGRGVAFVHCLALLAAAGVVALSASSARWSLWPFAVIAVFTVASGLTYVQTDSFKLKVSGSFLGLMLAAIVLGGGPAAIIGALSIATTWLRSREAPHYLRNNFVTYAWFPLAGGLLFHLAVRLAHVDPHAPGYYLIVFVVFVFALVLNFLGVAGYQCYLDRSSLMRKAQEVFAPVLAAELFSALLTMAAVYVAMELGTIGIALFGLVLVIFQFLVGQLLESKRRGDKLQRMATIDELSGLPNRARFRVRLEEEIKTSERAGRPFGVLLMDLDRFKEVNDALGHHYGDLLLGELGPRLAACVGPDGLVARLGGDEFAVLPGQPTDDPEVLQELAARLLACVQQPFVADELSIEVGASVGIARFPRDGEDGHALLRRADIAMYAAKETQSGAKLYAAQHDRHSLRRLNVLSDVRHALDLDQLVVHYQPIVDLGELRIQGAEGLVRWQHPELGLLAPGAFIQTVEQTGLIRPLTLHVLERSISRCVAWRSSGRDLTVAVNLSVRNLLDSSLPNEIEAMLRAYGLPPDALQLEITESMIMSDLERVVATVTRLSALGVRISVDDFGTGYSSLANLRRLPIDELKIDRSFVSPMLDDDSDLIIVRSTINLGHDLGLRIIAEGVEDEPTLERLALLGCDLAQGFHLSRPLAPGAFEDWISEPSVQLDAAVAVA